MGGFAAGLIGGIGEAFHEKKKQDFLVEMHQKKNLADVIGGLANNENAPEEVRNMLTQLQLDMHTGKDNFKKQAEKVGTVLAQLQGVQQQQKQQALEGEKARRISEAQRIIDNPPQFQNPVTSERQSLPLPPGIQEELAAAQGMSTDVPRGPIQWTLSHGEILNRKIDEMQRIMMAQGMIKNALSQQERAQLMGQIAPFARDLSPIQMIQMLMGKAPTAERATAFGNGGLAVGSEIIRQPDARYQTLSQGQVAFPVAAVPLTPPSGPNTPSQGFKNITAALPGLGPGGEQIPPSLPGPEDGQYPPGTIIGPPKAESQRSQAVNMLTKDGRRIAVAWNPTTNTWEEIPGIAEVRPKSESTSEPLYPVMVGSTPTYLPRSQASGKPAVRQTFDLSGMPTTGGVPGISLTPPPTIPQGTQQELAGLRAVIDQFDSVKPFFSEKQAFGPVAGRVTLAEVGKLGGMGATPREQELAIRLDNILTSRAFANGGKQLTGTELERFQRNTPQPTDTLQQALVKTKVAVEILENQFQRRLQSIPQRQRDQLPPDLTGARSLPAPSASAPIVQHSPSTGKYRHSLDGGKTWKEGKP